MSIYLKNDPFSLLTNNNWLYDDLVNWPKTDVTFLSNRVVSKVVDNKLEVAVSVLGHDPKKVNVELTEDRIYIKAEADKENKSVISSLISDINETLKLGRDYDGLTAKATIKDGVLHIVVDKKEEAKPKKLSIKF
jgi:HSP20 family molecular chaperone IbpA